MGDYGDQCFCVVGHMGFLVAYGIAVWDLWGLWRHGSALRDFCDYSSTVYETVRCIWDTSLYVCLWDDYETTYGIPVGCLWDTFGMPMG